MRERLHVSDMPKWHANSSERRQRHTRQTCVSALPCPPSSGLATRQGSGASRRNRRTTDGQTGPRDVSQAHAPPRHTHTHDTAPAAAAAAQQARDRARAERETPCERRAEARLTWLGDKAHTHTHTRQTCIYTYILIYIAAATTTAAAHGSFLSLNTCCKACKVGLPDVWRFYAT